MATKQVNIDIIAKDKTRMAMQSATKGVDNLKQSVFNLKNALVGLGAGLVIKSFVDVGKQVESLQIRLKFLFGSAREGAKAFDVMSKFASKVPFSLEQIQQGAGNLAVVSKNAEELNEMLEITGRVASVTGLDFRTTAEQIQRSFSAGVASADIFRERGVRDLLGFKAGATVTAEETAEAFRKVFGKDGRFANATSDLAETLEGTLSMIGDKFFNFQKVVAQSFFIGLKQEFGALDKALQDNQDTIDKIAKSIGKGLSEAVIVAGNAIRFVHDNFEAIKALGMAIIVGKIATAFLNLAKAIGVAKVALVSFSKVSRTTVVGALVGITTGVLMLSDAFKEIKDPSQKMNDLLERKQNLLDAIAKSTGNTKKLFEKQLDAINDQIEAYKNNATAVAMEIAGKQRQVIESKAHASALDEEIKKVKELADLKKMPMPRPDILGFQKPTGQELSQGTALDASMSGSELLGDSMPQIVALQDMADMEVQIAQQTADKKKGILDTFNQGFMSSLNEQKSAMSQIEDIGRQSFGKLKDTLTDFVMTGKLNIGDLGKFVVKSFINMLVGEAVKMAFAKSSAMFKADAIAKGTASLFQGALKTFAEIPFPLNLVAVGGAIAFGSSLLNKIKGFEKGGRPPIGQPSIVGEKGAELFVPDQAGTIVPNDKLGNLGKAVTVNFNINTVDARGFNELLVNSRGVIVNMINQAVNEKGRMAII